VNGAAFEVELKQMLNPTKRPIKQVVAPEATSNTRIETPKKPQAAAPAGGGANIEAPLPGTIVDIKVNVGDKVKSGDTVVILEAMKMQNNIETDIDGEVTAVLVRQGDSVMEGTALVTIA
ncbi:MAG: biotin/lipoyl-containing protein, partial [Prevotella sp.]|nr:biotin/lipoyl-containing protein [Prevotella sp.]